MKISNLYTAPKSSLLGLVLLVGFTLLHSLKYIDKETYGMISVPLIGFVFTDTMKENKKEPEA